MIDTVNCTCEGDSSVQFCMAESRRKTVLKSGQFYTLLDCHQAHGRIRD